MKSASNRSAFGSKPFIFVTALILIAIGFFVTFWLLPKPDVSEADNQSTAKSAQTKKTEPTVPGVQLVAKKNYGNKYASGILPVGDGKYSATSASKGSVYVCSQYAQNLAREQGGAGKRGPWFSADGKTYDITKKTHVRGAVKWIPQFSNTVSGSQRVIVTNDLPAHTTGTFPIAAGDPAYMYDRNPNRISAQSLTFDLPLTPTYGTPQCVGGEIGIMLSGVELFNGLDAAGRDAGAWEVQDDCSGHPQKEGLYHYHTVSSCIGDTSVTNIIGYALDGFPITGPKVSDGNILTSDDLDECHGIFSKLTINDKPTMTYHYVMTQDFPYSISCYRSAPTQTQGTHAQTPQRP